MGIKVKIKNRISAIICESDREPKGLVILIPGYLDTKDYNHLKELSTDLANDGYIAVRFDPTGTWESGGGIESYTVGQELRDITDILEYMGARSKYERIILGGHSLGGFISILYAASDPKIASVFAIMPPYALARSSKKIEMWNQYIKMPTSPKSF